MSEPILTARDLKKSFNGFEAVKGISFSVLRGEIFGLLGPNGAGKTTTISMLSCLLRPTSGDAEIDGHSVTGAPNAVKRVIGVVPQEIALYNSLDGRQNLFFWGRMYGMGGKSLAARVEEVLSQVGLSERAKDKVETYSGGMKRRLNIAAGLLHRPKLLFMDEPTVGIDPQSRRNILDMVKELRAEGMTVLYTTHYMEEAEELSDRVGIIDQGRLIALGTQKELTTLVGQQQAVRLRLSEGQIGQELAAEFAGVPDVLQTTAVDGQLIFTASDAAGVLPRLITRANQKNIHISSIDIEEPNLEAVFLHLTGRGLRD